MTEDERKSWLEERKRYITASDVAAVLGLSPYKKPLQVFYEKTNQADDFIYVNKHMQRGIDFEEPIFNYYKQSFSSQYSLTHNRRLFTSERYPFLAATPDALGEVKSTGEKFVVDIKCPRMPWVTIPRHYRVQAWAQMVVCDVQSGYLVAMCVDEESRELIPSSLRSVPLLRSDFIDREADFLARIERFYNCVRSGTLSFEFW